MDGTIEPAHISSERLAAFLLERVKLSEDENAHLAKCALCMHAMADTASDQLDQDPD